MSRIAKLPVKLPQGVNATIAAGAVTVKGAKGSMTLTLAQGVTVAQKDQTLVVSIAGAAATNERIAAAGAARANLANMVTGVSAGFKKTLEIVGTGYRAQMDGKKLVLQLGYSHPVVFPAPEGITFATESPTRLTVSGIDRALVGQIAANIREKRPPEPYKGKGIKYEGERIRRKAGKSAGA